MRVFITGGTGAIGSYAVSALIGAGHVVSALARSDAKANLLTRQGATPARVSLFDRESLTAAMAGCDAVVNVASALPSTAGFLRQSAWRECQRVRGEGSAAVVDACRRAGVPTLIQESVAMIYADNAGDWIDEDHPVEHYPIASGNHAAEANARRFADTGGCAVVLRFGVFYGRGAAHSEQILALARHHIGFVAGRGDGYMSSIHVADAAAAVVAALECRGGTFNVVDDEPVTKRQHATACAEAVDTRPWMNVPGRLGLLLGDRLTSLTRSLRVSNARFRTATDWKPRYPSVREGYRDMGASVR
ncbi:MAG: NAD-dependent epimerase/dehydratase family protein [Actinomycetota bacterium]